MLHHSWPRPYLVVTQLSLALILVSENTTTVLHICRFTLQSGQRCLGYIADLADWINMAGQYVDRMFFLLELFAYLLAYTDTDQCQVCQTPLIQYPRVPWQHLLTNTTKYFSGLKYRNMVRVLPNNSFVSGSYIQVCIGNFTHIIAHGIRS